METERDFAHDPAEHDEALLEVVDDAELELTEDEELDVSAEELDIAEEDFLDPPADGEAGPGS